VALTDDIRKSVIFIGHGDEDHFKSCGTGFFISYDSCPYLVTARHVAQDLGDDPYSFRINKKDRTSDTFQHDPLDNAHDWFRWFFPSDPTVDVAVIPFSFALKDTDVLSLRGDRWILDEARQTEEVIGVGDLCHAVGLFKIVQGARRNVPLVHTGRLALVAGEDLIPVEDWNDRSKTVMVRGHLVELTNLEGLSGAPVFVRGELQIGEVPPPIGPRGITVTDSRAFLLGVWQGSWNHQIHDGRRPLAMGVVVPASDLLALLLQDDVVAAREVHKQRVAQHNAASLDAKEPAPAV